MGSVATSYFYKDIYVPTITDKKILNKLPLPALKAYLKGRQNKKMISLFDSANKGWRLIHKDKWFGSTYQLTAPSNWGNHYLGMNINIALTQHLKRSFIVMDKTINVKAENKKYPILGRQSIAHHGTESNHRKTKSKIKQTVSSKKAKKTPHKHNTPIIEPIPMSRKISNIPETINETKNRSTITTYLHTNSNMYQQEAS